MKVLHLNAGNETGGGMFHILSLLNKLDRETFVLGVFEEGEMIRRARELGIRTVVFRQTRQLDLRVMKKLKHYIKEENIGIVHTHGPRANVLVHAMKHWLDIPWVVTVHSDPRDDFMGKGWKGNVMRQLQQRAIRSADHCIAISERFKKVLLDFSIPGEKITTILNGLDFDDQVERPYTREELGFQEADFLVVMVARLEQVKQHALAFAAFREVHKNCPGCKLVLVGDGPERNNLQKLAKELNIQSAVYFLGHRNDVDRILPMMDVELLTSKSESFPLVLLEAARAEVPVISTDVGGVKRLVPSKKYGWLVQPSSRTSIAEAILEAVEQKKEGQLKHIGAALQKYAAANFSIDQFASQVQSVYKKLH
ncbi:glycosyltransferase family 4 protein [Thalassobacillus devorans]|uniref:glycosyltransferase family 4 protein n=1 Tax=Thalassobacillus devorans TaxID=279813 RepID=UPI00048CD0C4|nr:glycosyltransferase family 4 protein [Thalassobacillus devorans]